MQKSRTIITAFIVEYDLRSVPTGALKAELARRKLAGQMSPDDEVVKRWKWVCSCGNTAFGGGDLSKVFAESGRVWCRICLPSCYINYYGKNGEPASVPMEKLPA